MRNFTNALALSLRPRKIPTTLIRIKIKTPSQGVNANATVAIAMRRDEEPHMERDERGDECVWPRYVSFSFRGRFRGGLSSPPPLTSAYDSFMFRPREWDRIFPRKRDIRKFHVVLLNNYGPFLRKFSYNIRSVQICWLELFYFMRKSKTDLVPINILNNIKLFLD